jgi:hypothetical protein
MAGHAALAGPELLSRGHQDESIDKLQTTDLGGEETFPERGEKDKEEPVDRTRW